MTTAAEKLFEAARKIERVEQEIRKEFVGMESELTLLKKWKREGLCTRFSTFADAVYYEARNRVFGWGK